MLSFRLKGTTEDQTGFIPSIVQSFSSYLLHTYYIPDTVVSGKDMAGSIHCQ